MNHYEGASERIYVPDSFDGPACHILYRGLIRQRNMIILRTGKKVLGCATFYHDHIAPTVVQNYKLFYRKGFENKNNDKSDDCKLNDLVYEVDGGGKILQRFLNNEQRVTEATILFFKTIYCYLTITDRSCTAAIRPVNLLEQTGDRFGRFLSDPKSVNDRIKLAIDRQQLLGIYSYSSKNSIGSHTGEKRYLAFLGGVSNDHIFSLDFSATEFFDNPSSSNSKINTNETIKLYYGFCIPSRELSPLIMRSWCLGERLTGLIYTPNALIDFDHPSSSSLKMDFFTTDKYRLMQQGLSSDGSSSVFASAQAVFHGPRIQVSLSKLNKSSEISALSTRIGTFVRDHLQ